MEIRPASISDYDTIYNIAIITWNATYGSILTQDQMDYMINLMYSKAAIEEQISVKEHKFLLAERDGIAIGFASYENNYEENTTKLHKLYVLPQSHGAGLGKLLTSLVEEAAQKADNGRLILNVNRDNPAYHFYIKSGFENMGEDNIDIGNGYLMEDYLMCKYL